MLHETANAKINLFLDVTARRPDGYHELHSCMQTVGLCDTVSAELRPATEEKSIALSCTNENLPTDEKNLAWRAARAYMEARGIDAYDIRLHIEKRIPLAAGLGGGSADAAAVLRLLNAQSKNPLPLEELCQIGATLGADVPFCVTGGTCRCKGVGEILTHVPCRPDYTVLIAKDGEGVSTPEAFALLDQKYGDYSTHTPLNASAVYEALAGHDVHALAKSVYNIFEDVIFPIRPRAKELKEFLLAHGALCALMSGSGPSVFAIFRSDARAEVCAATLRQRGIFAAVGRTN